MSTTTTSASSPSTTGPPLTAQQPKLSRGSWGHTVASQTAGAVSTLCFYPLDVVKMRYMAQDGTALRQHNGMRYDGVGSALRAMVREEGYGSLFRGAHVAVGAAVLSWGLFMYVYRSSEQALLRAFGETHLQAPAAGFIGSLSGNVTVAFLSNPMWLIKTRMQLEDASGLRETERFYPTVWRGLQHAVHADGLASLWRGTSAQLLVCVPNAVAFPLYEWSRRELSHFLSPNGTASLSVVQVCACSLFTKCVVSVLCHPFVLIKTRLQDAKRSAHPSVRYESVHGTFTTVLRREGLRGLYRGLAPSLIQTVPRGAVQFGLYEAFQTVFLAQRALLVKPPSS